ncbi:MAG: T9SS type A sorting domain-containing protein [candidate division Zixibacteria bacterium]|nr:T9SS type A sorting domain-containing protein [candidate division Zixibacteria bacterium]
MRELTVLVLAILAVGQLSAADKVTEYFDPVVTDVPDHSLRVHRASNIALSVTNYGKLGSEGRGIYDPYWNIPAPSVEFPIDSGLEHLFQGCLWIGAVVEGDEPGQLDTLVSIGDDGWWSNIYELNPPPHQYQSFWLEHEISDEEYYALYLDTCTVGVAPDPNDDRPHRPMGLKVVQRSMCWSTSGYDEFFVIDYIIENIYSQALEDVWIGIYIDADVMHINEAGYGPEEGAQDDLCGFIEHGERGIAWIADNNGQPQNGEFDSNSSRDLMGFMLLGSSTPGLQTNFNWWISNINSQADWGPRLVSNYDGPYPGGGNGTPGGDIGKYKIMSNGERDYDQAYSALDWTNEGWIPNNSFDPNEAANGFDTRYLMSLGTFDITPGEIETVTVAYIGGSNLHSDPYNYANNLHSGTDDSLSIVEYYSNLDFSDLIEKADSALSFYQTGYESIPLGPPHNFTALDWEETFVELAWDHQDRDNLLEYRIYRGTESGVYDELPITPNGFIDSSFTDTDVEDNTYYYYVIARVNTYNRQGALSEELVINTGQPSPPTGLTAERGNHEVQLNWNANPEDDIQGYFVYRAINLHLNEYEFIDTSLTTGYLDTDLANGFRYFYKLTAFDIYGIESFHSDTVSAIPMELNQGILLINANRHNSVQNPDYDSMVVFYENLLENSGYQYAISNSRPDTIADLTPYEIVVWCKEHLPAPSMTFLNYDNLISSYLDGGGKLILNGSRLVAPTLGFQGIRMFGSTDFQNEYLNLDGVEYPNLFTTEFVGGQPTASFFPGFDVDIDRANRITFPDENNDGRLFGIGALIPRESSESIYAYESVNPDTSNFHDRPIAIIHHGENHIAAVLEFPLYYVEEPTSFEIFNNILQVFEGVDIEEEPIATLPEKTSLLYNYPNPFNAVTRILFELAKPSDIEIDIYDILGRRVETFYKQNQPAGQYSVIWHAGDLPSGIYFCKLQASGSIDIGKMLLLK